MEIKIVVESREYLAKFQSPDGREISAFGYTPKEAVQNLLKKLTDFMNL